MRGKKEGTGNSSRMYCKEIKVAFLILDREEGELIRRGSRRRRKKGNEMKYASSGSFSLALQRGNVQEKGTTEEKKERGSRLLVYHSHSPGRIFHRLEVPKKRKVGSKFLRRKKGEEGWRE